MVGDIDPIKAAQAGLNLSDELTMHYGLLPRANRGIFAINELPDLAGKIQVGLFNILQEGDVQIKGYPIRLKLDVMLVFTANPEDYTARGKIITPLKDRIGSEIRTHYPATRHNAMAITKQEAWTDRVDAVKVEIPSYVREVVEEVAFQARADRKIDKRSGVSQRLPITTLELVVSNAERRALANGENARRAAGHGRLRGAAVDHRKIRARVRRRAARRRTGGARSDSVARSARSSPACSRGSTRARWWSGSTSADRCRSKTARPRKTSITLTKGLQGIRELAERAGLSKGAPAPAVASAIDFVLEGLYAQKKISRTDERGYSAVEADATAPDAT